MHRPVMLLSVFAAMAVTVTSVSANPLTGNERFSSNGSSQQSTPTLAPAKRVEPVRQIEAIQRSDSAALLIPTLPGDNLRPTVSNTVDSTASLGKITTSSVSKLILNSEDKPATQTASKSGETNPLLEALRWKGANSSQVGVPSELWCADFMNFILGQTGQAGTGSRAARSFLKYGKPLDGPRVGAIVVLARNGGHSESGHVGIVRGTDGEGNPIVISGNHGKKVAESVYKKEKVLGYFMPPSAEKANAATMSAAVSQVLAAGR
jgi:uncharacterized protein (TIGR02594 family)